MFHSPVNSIESTLHYRTYKFADGKRQTHSEGTRASKHFTNFDGNYRELKFKDLNTIKVFSAGDSDNPNGKQMVIDKGLNQQRTIRPWYNSLHLTNQETKVSNI